MDADPAVVRARFDGILWPLLETLVATHDVAGLAVAVVHEGETFSRCFGVRSIDTRLPVTPDTMFHLASVSKPFVATAIVSLATAQGGGSQHSISMRRS